MMLSPAAFLIVVGGLECCVRLASSGGLHTKRQIHVKLPHGNKKCNSARVLKQWFLAGLAGAGCIESLS
jgi:hypothetical protein